MTSNLNLLSVVSDYRHMLVNGKDVYILGEHHYKCKTGQSEARELLHYLFSDQTHSNNVAFIYEDNEFYAKNEFGRVHEDDLMEDWSDYVSCELIKSVNEVAMLNIVREICYLNPLRLNPQVSVIRGDARGPELSKKLIDAAIGEELSEAIQFELVSVSMSCISMLYDDRFTQEFKEKNKKILKEIVSDIHFILTYPNLASMYSKLSDEKRATYERGYKNMIYRLTDFYFYLQIHFYALSYDKIVLYAGAAHTRDVCDKFLLKDEGVMLVGHVNPYIELINSLGKNLPKDTHEIDFDQKSIISEFLPEIFGVTIDTHNSIEFLCNIFGNKYISDLK